MLRKLTYLGLAGCLLLLISSAALPSPQEQEAQNKKVPKDQQEYELINRAYKESNPQTKLQVLDEWKQKYPETAFDEERIRLYMASYQQTNQGAKAIEAANELLKKVPGDFSALFTIASLTPFLGADEQAMSAGEKAAKALAAGGIDKQFASGNKPPNVTQEQWENARKQSESAVHQTLGWVAMQRKNNVAAETELKKVLELSPNSAQVSYWLGQVVLAQGDPNKNELALFSFARAASYEGPGALTAEGRKQVDEYLTSVYQKYAGTDEGLAEIKELAKNQALPPADLKIESAEVRRFKAEQERRKQHPKLYAFIDLKANLAGPKGDAIWADLRGKLTPEMQLYVVSSTPADRPKTLNLSSKPGGAVEATLNLENRLRSSPRTGSMVTFEGVASSLTKSPFRLTLEEGKVL